MSCRKTVIAVPVPQVSTPKDSDFWVWYREALEKSELVDYSLKDDSYFILRPASCAIWDRIQKFLDHRLNAIGVQNCAFPLSIFQNAGKSNEKDKMHVRNLATDQISTVLVIYSHFAKWIKTHRDLPLRINQWKPLFCHESQPQPFLRSRELLIQEAHTAHLTAKDADEEIQQVLDIYATLYEDFLAIPVIKGQRSRLVTTSPDGPDITEAIALAYIPALDQFTEAATCRAFGQSFSKPNNITVPDPSITSEEDPKPLVHVWQNSWCFSNRSMGIMLATHGDNEGLVLPPRVAEHQVVIIPGWFSSKKHEHPTIQAEITSIESALAGLDVRVKLDLDDRGSPGWKLHEWKIRGAPLCIILGMKELSGQYAAVYRRDLPKESCRADIPLAELPHTVPVLLESIQNHLLLKARDSLSCHRQVADWQEFVHCLRNREEASVCLAPHCLAEECEQQIQSSVVESGRGTKIRCLCIPWSQPILTRSRPFKCINPQCEIEAQKWAMFGYKLE
ncbi:class II aaRS and biotin synthetase [Aspergillus steynii IBT 23096]|uniref:proline--tRNA ligase n=1 Tax=Aspergillus steynii IBT 23096 TaxID=1392250 RepID=A0A2I2FUK6_9EURO|nr:class II aaRS and biotin synthetase [Aspergillus steynii IBT 23096]PLB44304.1 class II aaRS and biotin synthetase [Aspergillus steynii IBT 23096]